jgi:DNA-binding NarL/FixJ family response regulator
MRELRILIADDHPLIRRGVRDLLQVREKWLIVAEASNGTEAVEKTVSLKPDVAILDFSMPELSGAEAATVLTRRAPETAVILLTMHDCDQILHQILRSGARGLVMKSDADRTLLSAVEAVAEKRNFFTERASDLMLGGYLKGNTGPSADPNSTQPKLTDRESEVLRLLADGMTSRQAADQLRISTRTVESHRSNMSRKLGACSFADLVRYAMRQGIIA